MQEMPIQSAITNIQEDLVEGYAYSGSGRGVSVVEFSLDDGNTWTTATLDNQANKHNKKDWAWVTWKGNFKKDTLRKGITCRATDNQGLIQTHLNIDDKWNLRGLNNNTYHKYHKSNPK